MSFSQPILIILTRWMLILPLLLGGLGLLGLSMRRVRLNKRFDFWLGCLTITISLLVLVLSLGMILAPANLYPLNFSVNLFFVTVDFYIDALSLYFILLVNIVALFASWNSLPNISADPAENWLQHPAFFHASVNLFHFTMLLVPMVNNLIGLWIAIEATTLVSALLVGYRNNREAWEAAWKYLMITSTGIILALLGTIFLANAVPAQFIPTGPGGEALEQIMNWTFLMESARQGYLIPDFVELSFLFILLGYGTKAGLAPMHTWLPDGHGEAPAPISALLSGVLIKSALYAILRFYTITNTVLGSATFTSTMLLGAGLFSLLLAAPFILKQNRFKRVLAYHSLEHMGIITFGIGIGGSVAIFGALLHALNHAITKSLMFLSFGNIMHQYKQVADEEGKSFHQDDITGVLRTMPLTGIILTLGGLALVGTPPFNIFMSEFIILWGALSRLKEPVTSKIPDFPAWLIIIAILLFMFSTTMIFYGLVRHLAHLVLHKMPSERRLKEDFWMGILPLLLLLVMALTFGLWIMPPLADLISASVNIVLDTKGTP